MARRNYSSTAVRTTLSAPITDVATSLVVADATGYPTDPFTIIVDADTASEEVMTVTSKASTTFTVTRGVEGTSAIGHSAGATVQHGVSARDFDEPNAFLNTGGTVTGNVVVDGTLDTTGAVDINGAVDISGTLATGPVTVTGGVNTSLPINVNIQDGSTTQGIYVQNTGGVNGSRLSLSHGRGTSGSPTQSLNGDVIGRFSTFGTTQTGAAKEALRIVSQAFANVTDANPNIDSYIIAYGTDAWITLKSDGAGGTLSFEAIGTGTSKIRFETGSATTVFNDAGVITSGTAGASFGPATSFTPTIGGTGWALGNATHSCKYIKQGRLVWARIQINWGSTSTFGTGALTIGGFPASATSSISVGTAHYTDGSTIYLGSCQMQDTSGTFLFRSGVSPMSSVTNTVPFTWANGDDIHATVVYETSS